MFEIQSWTPEVVGHLSAGMDRDSEFILCFVKRRMEFGIAERPYPGCSDWMMRVLVWL